MRSLYRRAMAEKGISALDFNAEWLREQRSRLGWSTTVAANRAREKAREFGDSIKLAQQLVSKFENGGLKSIPRWLGYMQLAMADEVREKGLPEGRLWKLRLPQDAQAYFADRLAAHNERLFGIGDLDLDDNDLSPEDLDDLAMLQQLSDRDREAVRLMMRALAERGAPAPSTVHTPGRAFSESAKGKGKAA